MARTFVRKMMGQTQRGEWEQAGDTLKVKTFFRKEPDLRHCVHITGGQLYSDSWLFGKTS